MAERSKAHAWSACKGQKPFAGSNPAPSARFLVGRAQKSDVLRLPIDLRLRVLTKFYITSWVTSYKFAVSGFVTAPWSKVCE